MNLEDIKITGVKKILITGCAGFIGSNLLEFFLSKNIHVLGLDNFSTGSKDNIEDAIKSASKINRNIRFELIDGDIRDYSLCSRVSRSVNAVFHEAALSSVQRSYDNPIESNSVNINGTLNILKASLENKVGRFIFASSSSIYGDSKILPKDEGLSLAPKSIYAVSKLASEYHCRLFYSLFGLNTISLRYFNVFGWRQDPDSVYSAVIPLFIKNIINNEPLIIFGDGEQSRDFTYIDNVVYANYLALMTKNHESFGNFYNIACGKKISLNEIIVLLEKFFNRKIIRSYTAERKGDIKVSLASIEKAHKDLNYSPLINFKEGVEELVQRFKNSNRY